MGEAQILKSFNASYADVMLVSSDKVRFKVNRINLITASTVFRDMLETGGSAEAIQKIQLEESGAVLEIILPYCSPNIEGQVFDLKSKCAVESINALVKYFIWYGVLAVENALLWHPSLQDGPNNLAHNFFGYSFAVLAGRSSLKKLFLNRIIDSSPSCRTMRELYTAEPVLCSEAGIEFGSRLLDTCALYKRADSGLRIRIFAAESSTTGSHPNFSSHPVCSVGVKWLICWSGLVGETSSKVIEAAKLGKTGEYQSCSTCQKRIVNAIDELLAGVKALEVSSV